LKKQISIIGCGWLGFSLAKSLINKGYSIKGSTTSKDKLQSLKDSSIDAYNILLNEKEIIGDVSGFLSKSEIVIINIPPGLRKNPTKNHVNELMHLISKIELQHVKRVIYISSTSVFKDDYDFPKITENTKPNAISNNGKQLIKIENLLQNNPNFKTTILRFGGLFDNERHPSKYLSGKLNVLNPEAPINLIHKHDCIEIIEALIQNDISNITLNAVYPDNTDKKTYYNNYCKLHNLSPIAFNSSKKSKGKIIDSTKLVQLLNYTFKQVP